MKFFIPKRFLHSKNVKNFDAVIIGGGHNGLVAAAYLQKNGFKVCVLEKRNKIGGAAVTEEIIPGFKFSRASYVLSLLRPQIYEDLELKKHGLKIHFRDPSSYTPLRGKWWKNEIRSLTLGSNPSRNHDEISKFSKNDAKNYPIYEEYLNRLISGLDPLFDVSPADASNFLQSKWYKKSWMLMRNPEIRKAISSLNKIRKDWLNLYEFITAPPYNILSQWFESEPLIATIASDAVIGSMTSPYSPGSGYVLLHHVMGQLEGIRGRWGYPEGGMGAVSNAIASSAKSCGATILTDQNVKRILLNDKEEAIGVVTSAGEEYFGKVVLSNATPKTTFLDFVPSNVLDKTFRRAIANYDYTSPVTKINVAVKKLPNFLSDPNVNDNEPMPHHQATIHLNCENCNVLHQAYQDALEGKPSSRPMIEMVIPSVLDPTLAPPGMHVCLLFTQYTPFSLSNGKGWDEETRENYAKEVFKNVDVYAPGFSQSVLGKEVLCPVDLERIFGLTGGNIFHGAISPNQIFLHRPVSENVSKNQLSPYTPVSNLLLCGSGAHPGGGVTGAPGRLAALESIKLIKKWKSTIKFQIKGKK